MRYVGGDKKMWRLIVLFLCALFLAGQSIKAEESHGADSSATPQDQQVVSHRQSPTAADLDALKQLVSQGPVNADWWKNAETLLDKMTLDDAKTFLDSLGEGDVTSALKTLVNARFVSSPDDLKKSLDSTDVTTQKAAKIEWDRRHDQDPNVQLISDLFDMRKETAMKHEDAIRKGIQSEDDQAVLKDVSNLYYSLSTPDRKNAVEKLKAEIAKEEVKNDPKRLAFAQRLLWTGEEMTSEKSSDGSSVESGFRDKAKDAADQADTRALKFNRELDRALGGDDDARKYISDHYSDAALLDFMSHNKDNDMGVKLAKYLGWQDKDGGTNLDVTLDKEGTSSAPKNETWSLGKTDDEIKKSLHAFDNNSIDNPSNTSKQFQHVSLDHDPTQKGQRNFFKTDGNDNHIAGYKPYFVMPEDKDAACGEQDQTPSKARLSMITHHRPNYFFRPFPYSDMGSYATWDNGIGQFHNYILDLKTGQEESIPGYYDPVPTPDEKFLTIPADNGDGGDDKGLTFFNMKTLLKGDKKPVFIDSQMGGVYQSIGVLPSTPEKPTYRIITDRNTLSMRDYNAVVGPDGGTQVTPVEKAPLEQCKGAKVNLALPMISKDGRQMSALDLDAGVTKIFDFDLNHKEADGTPCFDLKESTNLGIFTGKVDFNYDDDYIAFHHYNNEDIGQDYIDVPNDNYAANVYIYRRSTGEIARITDNTTSNAVYPAFRRDGKILYLDHPKGVRPDGKENDDVPSKLVEIDPKTLPFHAFDFFPAAGPKNEAQNAKAHAAIGLGALWQELCSPSGEDISAESAALATLSLTPDQCKLIVNKYWDSMKDHVADTVVAKGKQTNHAGKKDNDPNSTKTVKDAWVKWLDPNKIKGLTKEELLKACPQPSPGQSITPDKPGDGNQQRQSNDSVPTVIKRNCEECHNSSTQPIPWDDLGRLNSELSTIDKTVWAKDILNRISAPIGDGGHMPRGGRDLSPQEKAEIQAYLNGN